MSGIKEVQLILSRSVAKETHIGSHGFLAAKIGHGAAHQQARVQIDETRQFITTQSDFLHIIAEENEGKVLW